MLDVAMGYAHSLAIVKYNNAGKKALAKLKVFDPKEVGGGDGSSGSDKPTSKKRKETNDEDEGEEKKAKKKKLKKMNTCAQQLLSHTTKYYVDQGKYCFEGAPKLTKLIKSSSTGVSEYRASIHNIIPTKSHTIAVYETPLCAQNIR